MNVTRFAITVAGIVLCSLAAEAAGSHRIYGKIVTIDGDEYEGLIRWDKNEASWVDMLDAIRDLDEEDFSKRDGRRLREKRIQIFGITVGTSSGDWGFSGAQCGVRFGHIQQLKPLGDSEALLTLKSGQKVELRGSSTDLGSMVREIVVEDADEGEIHLVWDDIDYIEFMETGRDIESNFGERLYGTLTTRRGETFTGFVAWDVDEVFSQDVLDGEEDGRTRKIKFDKIKAIERYSSSGATVHFTAGEKVVLRGTNDVDDSNRGIIIADPAFGQVIVDWDEFDRIEFARPISDQAEYGRFDGGRPLRGTVTTEDGKQYRGAIRWDNDEAYTWEILDGESHDIQFDIEFGAIRKIEKRSSCSSIVTLVDGREFRLRGSNDVDSDNKGIFISPEEGRTIEVEWADFASVEFDHR